MFSKVSSGQQYFSADIRKSVKKSQLKSRVLSEEKENIPLTKNWLLSLESQNNKSFLQLVAEKKTEISLRWQFSNQR